MLSGETQQKPSTLELEAVGEGICVSDHVFFFSVVEGMSIKSLEENLSLCRINNNSSYHLLNTYYILDSRQACYVVV